MKTIRFPQLQAMLGGISRTTVWRWERERTFPQRIRLSTGCVVWDAQEVEQWLASRPRGMAA